MEKFIPYEKLSKKARKEMNDKRRKDWGIINPVTRKAENNKIYNRSKTRSWKDDTFDVTGSSYFPEETA